MKRHTSRSRALSTLALALGLTSTVGVRDAVAHEAAHAPLPVIGTEGGPVLAKARVIPIYYSSDPLAADLATFFPKLGTSTYLGTALSEYGIESVTIAPPIALADAPPAAMLDTDIATWLAAEIESGALPAPDSNTMYQIIYPAATAVSTGGLYGESYPTCSEFGFEAYLSSGTAVPFGVVPFCGPLPGLTDIDSEVEGVVGNIAGAVTNPLSYDNPAYDEPSWSGSAWAAFSGGYSLGLFCWSGSEPTTTPADLGYLVPRIWSNAAAAAGTDPCPDHSGKSKPYFNAAPDILGGTAAGTTWMVKGLIIPSTGGTLTIPVRLFSDRPTAPWALSAEELIANDGQPSPLLSFSWDRAEGNNGDVRQLTITRAPAPDGGIAYPSEVVPLVFQITSTAPGDGGVTQEWIGVVGNE